MSNLRSDQEIAESMKTLIEIIAFRRRELESLQYRKGSTTEVEIVFQEESLKKEIARLEVELHSLGERLVLPSN